MRLWHQALIPYLPRQQLLGQHRELCALRGKGWGRKHATVDYVFQYDPAYLVTYHNLIMEEMTNRGYHPDPVWNNIAYRGKILGYDKDFVKDISILDYDATKGNLYQEHNDEYLRECLDNLRSKGIDIKL